MTTFLKIGKKFLISGGLSLALTILLTGFAYGKSQQSAANESWNAFWTKFNNAVKTKNRKSLIALTSKRYFQDPVAGTINEWLNNPYAWRFLKNSMKYGTKPHECQKLTCRITRNPNSMYEASLVFVFDNNRWGFIGAIGE